MRGSPAVLLCHLFILITKDVLFNLFSHIFPYLTLRMASFLSHRVPVHLFVYVSVCLSIFLTVYVSICMSVDLPVCVCVHVCVYLSDSTGMGPPILPDEGLFLTWHFSLFSSLFNRMKRSKRRTFDPEKASLFIIPYDLGLDGYLDSRTCKNSRRCTRGHPEKVQEFVRTMPYFDRHQGRDHAVLWSLGQYHPWPSNGCDLFMRNFCEKCTFTCYWMDPTKADNRFVSIPFPSGYHWWDGIKELPWEVGSNSNPESADSRVESANDQGSSAEQRGQGRSVGGGGGGGDLRLNSSMRSNSYIRNLTAVYLGSTQTLNPAHTKIRRAMTAQCNVSSECHWKQIAHSSTDSTIADLLSTYRRSIFCLCPPGDDPARKGTRLLSCLRY